jgi:hypothetical protein
MTSAVCGSLDYDIELLSSNWAEKMEAIKGKINILKFKIRTIDLPK